MCWCPGNTCLMWLPRMPSMHCITDVTNHVQHSFLISIETWGGGGGGLMITCCNWNKWSFEWWLWTYTNWKSSFFLLCLIATSHWVVVLGVGGGVCLLALSGMWFSTCSRLMPDNPSPPPPPPCGLTQVGEKKKRCFHSLLFHQNPFSQPLGFSRWCHSSQSAFVRSTSPASPSSLPQFGLCASIACLLPNFSWTPIWKSWGWFWYCLFW